MKNEEVKNTLCVGTPEWRQAELARRQQEHEKHPVAHRVLSVIEKIFPPLAGLFFVGAVVSMITWVLAENVLLTEEKNLSYIVVTVGLFLTVSLVQFCWHVICHNFGYHFFFCKTHLYGFAAGAAVMLVILAAIMVSGKTLMTFERFTIAISVPYLLICAAIIHWNLFLPYWDIVRGED